MSENEKSKVFLSQSERKKLGLFRSEDQKFKCQYCNTFFTRHWDCLRHEKSFHNISVTYKCTLCGDSFYLAKSLPENHRYTLLKQSSLFKKLPSEKDFNILFEKWKYPYEFPQSLDEIISCTTIPPIEKFFNSLSGESISHDDYQNTVKIFNMLKCGNLKDYMECYCMLDVYLLAEVFTEFRKQTLENFEIDPCNFISLPGMGLQCFLKTSKIVLDFVYNGNISSFF